jgi:hypothetical protein
MPYIFPCYATGIVDVDPPRFNIDKFPFSVGMVAAVAPERETTVNAVGASAPDAPCVPVAPEAPVIPCAPVAPVGPVAPVVNCDDNLLLNNAIFYSFTIQQ